MARGINKVILIGNLGKDPETRYMPSGNAVTNITMATSDTWKDKQTGEQQERTEWHRVVFFNRLAEIAGEYLKKGAKVYIESSLRTRKLAALRQVTTPGPWVLFAVDNGWHINQQGGHGFVGTMPIYLHRSEQCYANAQLVAAAPEMAALLEQLADRLAVFEEWARDMCSTYCEHLSDEIIHTPNCPAADLGIDQEGAS